MTDPIDDGDRDDDPYGWDRDEPPRPSTRGRRRGGEDYGESTSERLSRLRDGLGQTSRRPARRGGRGLGDPFGGAGERPMDLGPEEQAGGADHLPDSIGRAIDRVGDVFGDIGRTTDTVRDPYADDHYPSGRGAEEFAREDFGREDFGREDFAEEDFDEAAYAPTPAPEPRRRRRVEEDPRERAEPESARGPSRQDRRAARARKQAAGGYGYDEETDPIPEPRAARGFAAGRDPAREPDWAQEQEFVAPSEEALYDDDPMADPIDLDRFDAERPGVDRPGVDRPGAEAPRGAGRVAGRWAGERRAEEDEPEIDFAFDGQEAERERERERDDGSRRGRRRGGPSLRRADAEEPGFGADPRDDGRKSARRRGPSAAAAAEKARAQRGRGAGAFGSLERLLAGRYLRARRKEGFISVIAFLSLIGITLAVAVLIVVMSVMNGFRAELIDKMVGVNGHLIITPLERNFKDFDGASKEIRAVPGVTRAAPLIEAKAFASSPRGGEGVLVRGLSKADLLTLEEVSVSPEQSVGDLSRFGEGDGIAIGAGLARRLGVTVGDSISLLSPKGSPTPIGMAPRRRVFDIDYIFKMGMSNYDDVLVFMPIKQAQSFFGRGGLADYIEVKVATPDRMEGYVQDIETAVGRPIAVTSWMENNTIFIGALKTEQSVMFLILSMLILIASLIIISGLIMLVKEKGSDIAILRTMGLSRGGVMRVFFMCGATIGVLGAALGVGLGVVVAINVDAIKVFVEELTGARLFPSEVYQFTALPSRLDWTDVGFTLLITLSLSFLATLYPAWRAARMDPVEALRYE